LKLPALENPSPDWMKVGAGAGSIRPINRHSQRAFSPFRPVRAPGVIAPDTGQFGMTVSTWRRDHPFPAVKATRNSIHEVSPLAFQPRNLRFVPKSDTTGGTAMQGAIHRVMQAYGMMNSLTAAEEHDARMRKPSISSE
jgi:hypothetical protein